MISDGNKFREISRRDARKLYSEGGIWITALAEAGITEEDLRDFTLGERVQVNGVKCIIVSTDSLGNPEWVMTYDTCSTGHNVLNIDLASMYYASYVGWTIPNKETCKEFIRSLPFAFEANNLPKHKFLVTSDKVPQPGSYHPSSRINLMYWYIDVCKGVLSSYYTYDNYKSEKDDYLEIRLFKKLTDDDLIEDIID